MENSINSFLFPLRHCKTLHLVRHGQGTHNIVDVEELDEFHFDAYLTPQGWQQVDDLRRHVRSSGLFKKVDLVIVSPLLRTLQTAVGVFGGDSYTDGIPLMVENVGSSDHPAISCLNCPPFLALEKCREIISAYPCDKRRSVSEYRKLFPAIDFSMIENNDDILWDGVKIETNEELASRGVDFLNWLWSRKEKEIAIVTHSGLLTHSRKSCKLLSSCD
ncbi:Phosphoglycerate mutase-like protein [Zostera marina]|uniref:Phosphoglycerate mutase-like protein n=1 Tax=Zostera marina TaxID=29655 RepID=A0A0K9NHY7_ZOSMR|nr:Phosphoglycerate mutase-like protein [Zostera marina]